MARRVALPSAVVEVTPGYSWRLDLDVLFDGQRPADWPSWNVRMHVWSDKIRFTLANGAGVAFEPIDDAPGAAGPVVVPVITMDAGRTESLRGERQINYLIDLEAPDGDAEDYFSGLLTILLSPHPELLA